MKTLSLFLVLISAAYGRAQTTFTITLSPEQVTVLSNAVVAANIAAQEEYARRTNEVAALLAAGDKFATNPLPPVVLTMESYVQGFANTALRSTQARLEEDTVNELKRRIDALTQDERRNLRRTLPNRRIILTPQP